MEVELRSIEKSNWQEIAVLKLADSQKEFLFDNGYSIAESFFCENSVIKGIYANGEAAGFLMYESLEDEGKPNEVEILRFMVNENHQGKGIGRMAFDLAIRDIATSKKPRKIHICFTKENVAANTLYSSFGFVDNGIDEHGQINLVLQT
ncbi:GNAT family N-acetyltransferase [Reinekea sp. G2M2-21]|uniref:GNAT family N-acetyltransferase n=1 Tax=Reinekea sp. G2M2-21 TaxID=2788942 RepID=UPI0018A90986|nr:GNAT family N-acetyltransferase [Reinekea sp. G2M2-21]